MKKIKVLNSWRYKMTLITSWTVLLHLISGVEALVNPAQKRRRRSRDVILTRRPGKRAPASRGKMEPRRGEPSEGSDVNREAERSGAF